MSTTNAHLANLAANKDITNLPDLFEVVSQYGIVNTPTLALIYGTSRRAARHAAKRLAKYGWITLLGHQGVTRNTALVWSPVGA